MRRNVSSIAADAEMLLSAHVWPGNIRELRNVVRQAVLLASDSVVQAEQIRNLLKGNSISLESPESVEVALLPGQTLKQIAEKAVEAAEKQAIRNVLKATGGNKSKAAKILKTDYKTLHIKVKKYGLKAVEE